MGIGSVKRAVFFDRDGVLNEAIVRDGVPQPPASLEELRIVAGAPDAIARIRAAGFLAIVVTNQPDVARGTISRSTVEAINERVARELGLRAVYTCFHDTADECSCRKPKPGLVKKAAIDYGVDLHRSFFVGDRVKDVHCGKAAGCTTVFLDRGYDETPGDTGADLVVETLDQAVDAVLTRAEVPS